METLQRTANRGSISTGYDIDNSLKLEADNSEYLYKTNNSGTNRKTFTVSMWFKRTELANDYMQLWQGGVFGEATRLGFYGGTPKEAIWVDIGGGTGTTGGSSNSGINYRSYSNQVLRDTSAFYHIVLAVDTTQATEANRWRLWLNGEEVTSWSQRQYPVQDYQCALEASIQMKWGAYDATYYKMCGYIAECHYLDGVTAVQTDFGEYDEDSGIWKPKAYAGSYGGNGCYLNFDDSASLGADSSGNGNNFTLNNITSADQATDTPTNNFCTLNPLWAYAGEATVNNGATTATGVDAAWNGSKATMGVRSGKWYWEVRYSSDAAYTGLQTDGEDNIAASGSLAHVQDTSISFNGNGKYVTEINGSSTSVTGQTALEISSGAVQGFALDLDSGTKTIKVIRADGVTLTVNLTDSLAELEVFPFVAVYQNYVINYNFGGYTTNTISSAASDENGYGTFEYAPPSGYYALCTKNLAEYG